MNLCAKRPRLGGGNTIQTRLFWKGLFFSGWMIFSGTALAAGSPSSGDAYYKVRKTTGLVLMRHPFAFEWTPVGRGAKIREGMLLQTFDRSSVDLTYHPGAESLGQFEGEVGLQISEPIVVRLQPGILRQTKLQRHFVQMVPSFAGQKSVQPAGGQSLREAWSKLSVTMAQRVARSFGGESSSFEAPDTQGVQASVTAKKIEILAPESPLTIRTSQPPYEVMLRWKAPAGKSLSYVVYLWPSTNPRPAPLAETRQDRYTLSLPFPGQYLAQVTSKAGDWQSEPQVLDMFYESLAMAGEGASSSRGAPTPFLLKRLYPPHSHTVVGRQGGSQEFFSWKLTVDHPVTHWEWVLTTSKGHEVRRIATQDPFVRQDIPLGHYRWHVEAILTSANEAPAKMALLETTKRRPQDGLEEDQARRVQSDPGALHILQAVQSDPRAKIIRDFLSQGKSGSLYLSEGL